MFYVGKGLTCRQIGANMGIPHRTIQRYLKTAGISLRNPGHPLIDRLSDREWLEQQYIAEKKSTTEIADEIGCSARSVSIWLGRHRLSARPTGSEKGHNRNTDEMRQKLSAAKRGRCLGPDNPNWRGGIALRDPDRGRYRAKMWVNEIKNRDKWRCVECSSTQNLHAHHIKPWRYYPEFRYDVDNGITLCHNCHEAAHGHGFKFSWVQAS